MLDLVPAAFASSERLLLAFAVSICSTRPTCASIQSPNLAQQHHPPKPTRPVGEGKPGSNPGWRMKPELIPDGSIDAMLVRPHAVGRGSAAVEYVEQYHSTIE